MVKLSQITNNCINNVSHLHNNISSVVASEKVTSDILTI